MGLKEKDIESLRQKYGYNEITRKKEKSKLEIFIEIIKDPIILIMLAACLISVLTKEYTESYVIGALIIINIIIGFIQEVKTIEKLKSLEEMNEDFVTVIRDDMAKEIKAKELLPGDVVKLNIGIIARADMKVLEANNLQVDESFLTGESDEVDKLIDDALYSNSGIKNGVGLALVTAIGMNTKIGEIAKQVDDVVSTESQLDIKIKQITKALLYIALIVALSVFGLSFANNMPVAECLSLTISILIATVPEGLATVLTIVLTYMSTKMSQNNALIKKVPLLETLGEVSYVCTDKTGTITENKMQVVEHKYFNDFAQEVVSATIDIDTPTSRAISNFVQNVDIQGVKVIESIPFNSTLKRQVHLIEYQNKNYVVVIGAPDFLVDGINSKVPEIVSYMNKGLRCILFTIKETKATSLLNMDFRNLDLLALYGISDPPKQSAIDAVKTMHKAGIKVVMITGDNLGTASAIAKQTGIIEHSDELAITGEELNKLSDEEFFEKVEHIRVYARVKPEDKFRIVLALQSRGEIVAMTGDGTNDSIALKQSNVGVAMGINGTDISKESADLILLDDNFATINVAIEGGRLIFDNLRKFIRQMLTSNAAHTGSILFTLIFGMFLTSNQDLILPMTPVLILWVNIISDAIPCLALGLDVAENDIMDRDPIDPDMPILSKSMMFEILLRGFTIGLFVYLIFTYTLNGGFGTSALGVEERVMYARTLGFVVLSFGQLIHIFDARSFKTIYRKNPFSNMLVIYAVGASAVLNLLIIYTPMNKIFELSGNLKLSHLLIGILFSSIVTFGYSIVKLFIVKK